MKLKPKSEDERKVYLACLFIIAICFSMGMMKFGFSVFRDGWFMTLLAVVMIELVTAKIDYKQTL